MKTGTKSLLFGIHQFIWHPIAVALAWRALYSKWPNWRESICIIVHDWGYWGCDKMDDAKGGQHPVLGARIVQQLFGNHELCNLVLLHSRHLARTLGQEPSSLCWPDKLSHDFYPIWLIWLLGTLTGEIKEYKFNAEAFLHRPLTNWEYAVWIKAHFHRIAQERLKASPETSSIVAREQFP